jgi:hypothetical protein
MSSLGYPRPPCPSPWLGGVLLLHWMLCISICSLDTTSRL